MHNTKILVESFTAASDSPYNYPMDYHPIHFFEEPIQVHFSEPPLLEKKPSSPDGFTWRGEEFTVTELLAEWFDYERRGRFARNMLPQHAAAASVKGSWGVGKFYFRVRTSAGRIFDIYYDRAPKDAGRRKGDWFIYQELEA